jgi:hypothetical protein
MLNNQTTIHVTLIRGRKGSAVGNPTIWFAPAENPRPPGCKKLVNFDTHYRIRAGQSGLNFSRAYRVVVETVETVLPSFYLYIAHDLNRGLCKLPEKKWF